MAAQGAGTRDSEPSRLFLAASYLMLLVGGAVLAIVGVFMLPYSVSSGASAAAPAGSGTAHVLAAGSQGGLGQLLSVGILVALIANPALSLAGLWTAGTRLAACTPLAGWLIVVIPLLPRKANGSLLLPSDSRTIAFLLLGVLAFAAVAALGRPTRGVTVHVGLPVPKGSLPAPAGRTRPPTPAARTRPPQTARNTVPRRTEPKRGRRR